jgi:hypothetical protein
LITHDADLKRLYHSSRGYAYEDVQVTLKHSDAALPSSDSRKGVIARRVDAQNHLLAYVTNNTLVLAEYDAGNLITLGSTAITALSAGTDYWIRIRCEGDDITAEHHTSEPTPMGTPAHTVTVTLAGEDAALLGAGVSGQAGIYWLPGASYLGQWVGDFAVEPYTYYNRTLPDVIPLGGEIPGDAPALMDLAVTHAGAGGSQPPLWALFAWPERDAPVFLEGESATEYVNMTVAADASYRGGQGAEVSVLSSGGMSTPGRLRWLLDLSTLGADDYALREVDIEVWARLRMQDTITSPASLVVSAWQLGDLASVVGAQRYPAERESEPKLITQPGPGLEFLDARVGTITLPLDAGSYQVGADLYGLGSGALGIDYLMLAPIRRRVALPTGVDDLRSSYPSFINTTDERTKVVRSDGSCLLADPPNAAQGDRSGFDGLLEVPTGEIDLVAYVAGRAPDNTNGGNLQTSHTATVHAAITPRYYLMRGA